MSLTNTNLAGFDFNEAWLQPGAVVPVDVPTTGALVREVMRLRGCFSDVNSRLEAALDELGAIAYHPVFDDGQDHDDGEPRVTGWECRVCGVLEPKLSTFEHLDECPLYKPEAA